MRRAFATSMMLSLFACSDPAPGDPSPGPIVQSTRLSGPYAHGNLTVFLVHATPASQDDFGCITLEEALQSGAIKVTEKAEGAEVNELQVENAGDKPVYLQAGDTVKGGQQDRTIAVDTILPPKSGKRGIDAFCVEPGRWHAREGTRYANVFGVAQAPVATNEQKLAIRLEKDQGKVWAAGERVNRDLATVARPEAPAEPAARSPEPGQRSTSSAGITGVFSGAKNSYVEAIEEETVQKKLAERIAALEKAPAGHPDAVGAVFCMNGKIQSAEIYAAAGLFRKLWPKLLRSASVEAISKQKEGAAGQAPAEADVRALLADLEAGKSKTEERPGGHTVRVTEKERAVRFDTEADGKLLHRQVLTR
jgi:hypothetical protein